jgi:hypothetical protein
MVDPDQNHVFVPLLTSKLETMVLSWAIFDTLAHLTFAPSWEK